MLRHCLPCIKASSITFDRSVTLAQVTMTHPFINTGTDYVGPFEIIKWQYWIENYEGRTESHEQQFFSCELGTADEGE